MPITVTCKPFDPLCKDYEFIFTDINRLVEMITELCLGQCQHVSNVIKALAPTAPSPDIKAIRNLIAVLDTKGKSVAYRDQIHGWLFQMISWIALAIQHKNDTFLQHYPQSQPAMPGIDGLAITLKIDNSIDKIIITEDKCTEHPRKTIKDLVWPEFDDYENGKKNSAVFQQIQSLFLNDTRWHNIQNDITKEEYREYRIAITREEIHNSDIGRKSLFKDFDIHVKGDDVSRRSGASVYIKDMRNWMETVRQNMIICLNNKLKSYV